MNLHFCTEPTLFWLENKEIGLVDVLGPEESDPINKKRIRSFGSTNHPKRYIEEGIWSRNEHLHSITPYTIIEFGFDTNGSTFKKFFREYFLELSEKI